MLDDFANKKYSSITIQGVLLASSLFYLEHAGPNTLVIFTVVIILSLFVLQAINHRFFYYFPINIFTGKETKDSDTYILYIMTFAAFLLFIWGIANSFLLAAVATAFIIVPGFLWKRFMYEKVRERITEKLKRENIMEFISCPHCGAKAVIGKRVFTWNKGYEIFECIEGCKEKSEKQVPLTIG